MTAAAWFLVGLFIGIDITLAYHWWTLRRIEHAVIGRVGVYTHSNVLRFDTPKARRALRNASKPW